MNTRSFLTLFACISCCLFPALTAAQRLTHVQGAAAVACVERTEGDDGPRPWRDHSYHVRYSIIHDPDEEFPNWHLVYVLFYQPDGTSGWVYKLYVHHTKPMVDIGEYGTVKKNRRGGMEIDDVWGGLGTHELIKRHLHLLESKPVIRIASLQAKQSRFNCYDSNNPAPE